MMFYERYAKLCRQRGLTPSFVALENGISKTSVTRWKNGAVPKSDLAAKLAAYLGVSVDYLVSETVFDLSDAPPVMIPIVGEIAAGYPIIAEQNIEGYAVSDVGNAEDYFYLRVRGDSMINAGIKNGALVLIRKQPTAQNNQIVACMVGGESATLKRFFRADNLVTLMPENPAYSPIVIPIEDFDIGDAVILGVGVRVLTDL